MPCIYAHDTFGRQVKKRLPDDMQQIIEHHEKEYLAGLQGPDFLFFYHPLLKTRTNQMGHWQHREPVYKFLQHLLPIIRREGTDSGVYAYVLGFICHFMLDSECHSFVIPLSKKPGYHHLAIENEFDRHLLRRDGHRPVTYPMWKKVCCRKNVIDAVFTAYKPLRLSRSEIREAWYGMKFFKWLLTSGRTLKRGLVRFCMLVTTQYEQLEGHMMSLFPKKYARKTNQSLQYIYDNAIPLTGEILEDFHSSVCTGKPLHERFRCNFRNNVSDNA